MAGESETKVPPYTSFTTFSNFINGLVETGIPGRIDNSLMRNISGSAQSSLLGALRYLNLVREDKAPTDLLPLLATSDESQRGATLRKAMELSYPFLRAQTLDLANATPQQLAESLRALGASGGTLDKAIAFFLAAAQVAGIPVSAHIMKRKHGGNLAAAKINGQRKSKFPRAKRADPASVEQHFKPTAGGASNSDPNEFEKELLAKFPPFDPAWSDELKAQWFKGFQQFMGMAKAPSKQE